MQPRMQAGKKSHILNDSEVKTGAGGGRLYSTTAFPSIVVVVWAAHRSRAHPSLMVGVPSPSGAGAGVVVGKLFACVRCTLLCQPFR